MVLSMAHESFVPLRTAVLTVSDTRSLESDGSGQAISEALERAGHQLAGRELVRDEVAEIRARARTWIAEGIEVVIVTGGTGLTGRDVTPEAMAPLATRSIPGFGELFRQLSYGDIGTATIHTRAQAFVCQSTYVFLLPGSLGACKMAMERIVLEQLDARTRPCNLAELLPRLREA
jgi:molybdenum cofactor biosynthesis protein B